LERFVFINSYENQSEVTEYVGQSLNWTACNRPFVGMKSAIEHGCNSNSDWQMSRTPVINQVVSNAWLDEQGLLSVKALWCKAQGYTARRKGKASLRVD